MDQATEVGKDLVLSERREVRDERKKKATGRRNFLKWLGRGAAIIAGGKLAKEVGLSLPERERVDYRELEWGDRLMLDFPDGEWRATPIRYADQGLIKVQRLRLRDDKTHLSEEGGIVNYAALRFSPDSETVRHMAELLDNKVQKVKLADGFAKAGVWASAGERLNNAYRLGQIDPGEEVITIPVITGGFGQEGLTEINQHSPADGRPDETPKHHKFYSGWAVLRDWGEELEVRGYIHDGNALNPVER